MANNDIRLAALCTPESFIRNTFVSDTFRGEIVLDREVTVVDIERFQVPFSPAREKILREKYGMTDEDLDEFYKSFSHGLRNGIQIAARLHKTPEFESKNSKSLISYVYQKTVRNGAHYDAYLLSRPTTRYLESKPCANGQMSFRTLIDLAMRLTLILHNLSEYGVYIGVIDMDTVCLTKGPPGSKPPEFLTFASLAYARSKDDKVQFPYQKVLPFSAHPSLLEGGQPTDATELYTLSATLAAFINGSFGTGEPSTSLTNVDERVPRQFVETLQQGMEGTIDLKVFIKTLRAIKRSSFFESDAASIYLPIRTEQPDYLESADEQAERRAAKAEKESPATVVPQQPEKAEEKPVEQEPPELLDGEFEIEPLVDKTFIFPDFALEN